jgi:hypothetical protein
VHVCQLMKMECGRDVGGGGVTEYVRECALQLIPLSLQKLAALHREVLQRRSIL